ncbi:CLUMA_CG014131, isoform A [Clunio marinus]|uniref:CLUMA_CG014131, isoform A n=1 Tax=Clunio marinus TaxID=568069 RepID=A0A1J1IL45_9DIPT|nr:CLUMA_CG014131, isoform A [Clunio marinus]
MMNGMLNVVKERRKEKKTADEKVSKIISRVLHRLRLRLRDSIKEEKMFIKTQRKLKITIYPICEMGNGSTRFRFHLMNMYLLEIENNLKLHIINFRKLFEG